MSNVESSVNFYKPGSRFEVIGHEIDSKPVSVNGATLRMRGHSNHMRVINRLDVRTQRVIELLGGVARLMRTGVLNF